MNKDTIWESNNIYNKYPLEISIINPFKSTLIKKLSIPVRIKGGYKHTTKNIQLGDLSVFDDNIENVKVKNYKDTSTTHSPTDTMVYPVDNIRKLRDKIYVATGIPPYRQHILKQTNMGNISLCYTLYSSNNIVDVNIFNSLQSHESDNKILNIPIDTELYNKRQDLSIVMNDIKDTLYVGNNIYISKIILCDLYDIINPNNDEVIEIMKSEQYRDLIYYGFIIKFFPILPYEGFNQVYLNRDDISYIYPYLKLPLGQLKERTLKEKELLDKLYRNIDNTKKYIKNITKRSNYYISQATVNIRLNNINVRNLFDSLVLGKYYVYAVLKLKVSGSIFWITKQYVLNNKIEEVSYNKISNDTILIITEDNIKIYISSNNISIETKYSESNEMTFDNINMNIKDIISPIIKQINNSGLLILSNEQKIDNNPNDYQIVNTKIEVNWPENCTTEQFEKFGKYLTEYENINLLYNKSVSVGQYDIAFDLGVSCCGQQKTNSILSQLPEITNQYQYYTNESIMTKWNDIARNSITYLQKASVIGLVCTGFSSKEFILIYPLIMSMLYNFSTCICSKMIIKDTEKVSKRLRKLKGIDPDLYILRRYDPDVTVYSVKCQSDRQPVIYNESAIKNLSSSIRNRLVKFWNFTEKKPVYYDCPNRTFPHLSFKPQDHPLGYCLPCCKKLIPSDESRQAKIDKLCMSNHIVPHKDIDELIKKLNKEYTHILNYGKPIGLDRSSYIPSLIENNILMTKSKYRLIGVPQSLPSLEDAGFIFSIIKVLGITMEKFAKDITKGINKDTYGLLDEGNTIKFESPDQLKNIIINMLVDTNKGLMDSNITQIDWINVFSELTYITYGIHIIIIIDDEGELHLRINNTTQLAILHKCSDNKFMIINSHDNGIYPLVETPDRMLFNCKEDPIMMSILDILSTMIKKVEYSGTNLNDIIGFVKSNKKYKISYLLRGKRGLVYAAILNDNVYVPCVYEEYNETNIPTENKFPNTSDFKRKTLYQFIDDYNSYIAKTNKNRSAIMMIDPVLNLKHKDKYVGIRVRFLQNKHGLTYHHAPESTAGRYNIKVINIPYSITSINEAISKQNKDIIDKNTNHYAYKNYVYILFMTEFAYVIRELKNSKIRKSLENVLLKSSSNVDKREIKTILNDYPRDYNIVIDIVSQNRQKKAINLINSIIFGFDLIGLEKLRDLPYNKRIADIKNMMKNNVDIVPKTTKPGISNDLISCLVKKDGSQCSSNGKLMMYADDFDKCCMLLAKDLEIPYIFESIHFKIIDTKNLLKFTKRKCEILHIKQLE